jgi:phosphoesterase RecJ-like protein
MNQIPEDDWSRALRLLNGAEEVALACDQTPDGDALGSLLAAAIALSSRGQRPAASWGRTPFAVPRALTSLPGQEFLVPPSRFPRAPGLLITFAAPDVARLGQLAGCAERAEAVIVVDDHDSNTRFGDVHLVDPDVEATVVIVDELLRRLGVPLSAEIAAPLYAGLSSDTGSFKYRVTSAAAHEFAARLMRTGFRHDLLARAMWDTHPLGYLRLLGAMLSRLAFEPEAAGGLGTAR